MRPALLIPLLLTAACSRPEPAPEDIDGALHYLWDGWEAGDDEGLAQAVSNLDAELQRLEDEGSDLPYDGTQSRLAADQVEGLHFTGEPPDPSLGGPFFVAMPIGCTLDEAARVASATNQDELHPGSYERYERTWTNDGEAFFNGEEAFLRWDVELDATYGFPVNYSFTERLKGGLRRVPGGPGGDDVLLGRTHLIEPATDEDDNKSFDQDYQLDVYFARPSDDGLSMVHVWAVWRVIDLGASGNQDSRLVIGTTISNAIGWDEEVTGICARYRETGELTGPG